MNNLKNIAASVVNDTSAGKVKYYFDGVAHPFIQLNASGAGNDPNTKIVLKGGIDRTIRELVGLFDASNGGTSWSIQGVWTSSEPKYALDASDLWNGAKELTKETVISTAGDIHKYSLFPEISKKASKVFFPSEEEYISANSSVVRKVRNACGRAVWSRTSTQYNSALGVAILGVIYHNYDMVDVLACAPAFNLDLGKVLMVRSASSGKEPVPFMELSNYHADSKESDFKFVAEKPLMNKVDVSVNEHTSVFISFTITTCGKWNASWFSAAICDAEGKTLFYGTIGSILESEFKVDIPSLPSGSYTINLYAEQRNDPYYTDYAQKIYSYTFML